MAAEKTLPVNCAAPAEPVAEAGSHILDGIAGAPDLRKLNIVELRRLASEIRARIIDVVSRTGGHLAPSLGVVELTLALHYVFDTPDDRIIWDVGHQSYAHKLVTGRVQGFPTLRQEHGVSGFPKRAESPYDVFDTGHAGESISVALGLATADRLTGCKRKTIAVIGDGSIVTGVAFEALNNAAGLKNNLIIILNDNEMSIGKTSGGFADYLNRMITGQSYNRLRSDVWNLLGRLPSNLGGRARLAARKLEEGMKNLVAPSVIFEELGFRYFGPFDGHNLITLTDTFRKVRTLEQPILVHVVTRKGKGYPPAEKHPEVFHGVGKFNIATGATAPGGPSFTRTFGEKLVQLAAQDPKIVAISAGMTLGTGLNLFRDRFPDRFFDPGISEQHAVAFGAGLALAGMKPVVAVYSTFLSRAYDQLIQDVCLQNLPVVLAVDRAGVVGEDGPTHHGMLDLTYLRCIPNLTVMAPADENELAAMLDFALRERKSPIALRYPRGGSGVENPLPCPPIEEGRAVVLHEGTSRTALLAIGAMVVPALAAVEILRRSEIDPTVVNLRFVRPLDDMLFTQLAGHTDCIFALEENTIRGGLGSALLEAAAMLNLKTRIIPIALPDRFLPHATRPSLLQQVGLDAESLAGRVLKELA